MNDAVRGNGFLWALVGCGTLLFVGLCVALGIGAYLVVEQRGIAGPGNAPVPTPPGPTVPVPVPLPPGGDKPPPSAGGPLVFTASVTEATGAIAGRVSRECRFAVEAPNADGMCRTQVVCDSLLLYGGPTAGYFPCRFDAAARFVSGVDQNTTSSDSDAAMTVDSQSRLLRISDDASGRYGEFVLVGAIR